MEINLLVFEYEIFGNQLKDYVAAALLFLAFYIILKYAQKTIVSRLENIAKKTRTDIDDLFIGMFASIKPPFYLFFAFWAGFQYLRSSEVVSKTVNLGLIVWATVIAIQTLDSIAGYAINNKFKAKDPQTKAMTHVLQVVSRIVLWIFGVLLILSNMGVNITSLVTGLGIGGVAVALALQNILGDLFSSIAIYLDQPFKAGDYIIVGTERGTVERIGLKTTHLKSPDGGTIVIPNKDLSSARIYNMKKMEERRIVFNLGVVYGTPLDKVRRIVGIVREIIESVEHAEFDRGHFKSFGDFALIFEFQYHVSAPYYPDYLDAQEKMNLMIKETFERENIEMAFPTQTLYVVNEK